MASEIHIRSIDDFNQLIDEELPKVKSIIFNAFVDREKEIPARIYACVQLASLSFFHMNKLVFSSNIQQLKQLKTLSIDSCPITEFPKEFGKLESLTKLILTDCPITTFPKEFGNLQALTILECAKMSFPTIPQAIFNCSNLQELSFRRSNIYEIPAAIAQLQALKKLTAHHSKLTQLPEALTQLPHLEALELYGIPITTLPEWIGDLKKIKHLGVPQTTFEQIPYFLFQLKKLVYYCIPAFTVNGVDSSITTQLQQYLKRHASVNCAKAYLHLMQSPNKSSKIPLKFFVEVTNIDDKTVIKKALNYLKSSLTNTLDQQPLTAGSEVAFLGKLDGLDSDYIKTQLSNNDIVISNKVSKTTTHVVLSYENKRKFDPAKFPNIVLLSNQEIVDWMKVNEGAGFLENDSDHDLAQMQESIQNLLLSSSSDNISTGLEMLKSGGIPSSLICPLLIAYSNTNNSNPAGKELRNNIRTALYQSSLSESTKKQIRRDLSKGGFSFHPGNDRIERSYKKRLERKGNKEFDMLGIATYYFKTKQRGYLYLMESDQVDDQDKIAFIQEHFIEGTTLNLSELAQLNKFPPILTHFQQIEHINLENCAFAIFPSLLRDGAFPKLKKINLKGNPINSLSKTVLKKLAHCDFLLD